MLPSNGLFLFLARGASQVRDAAGAVPPTGLALLSVGSTQLGAAIAKSLFDVVILFEFALAKMNLCFYSALALFCHSNESIIGGKC